MRNKYYLFLMIFFMIFVFAGCRSASRRVISNIEYHGYRVVQVEDGDMPTLIVDDVEKVYRIYDSEDQYLADLYEMESEDALIEALENVGYQQGDFPCNGNMMLVLKHSETLDLTIVFFDNDPGRLTAQ